MQNLQTQNPTSKTLPAHTIGWLFYGLGSAALLWIISKMWNAATTPLEPSVSISPIWIWLSSAVAVYGLGSIAKFSKNFIPALLTLILGLLFAEAMLRSYAVPTGLIPTPSRVMQTLWEVREVLLRDATTTFALEALSGYLGGVVAGIALALLVVRFRFLERGVLPYASAFSSIPIVALAPVVVKAFGLEWTSKAIIVGITVFFPVVVGVVRGLQSANPLALELMQCYGSSEAQVFSKLRIPSALPFLFNALKIASTLAMISAIVGEFFGTTGVGLGFRIQIEAGKYNLDIVWAAITIAAVLGISFYQIINLLERTFTFWHSSFRVQD